jgi:1-acyl-sn-glycerol-3-phosphate acyltransferase
MPLAGKETAARVGDPTRSGNGGYPGRSPGLRDRSGRAAAGARRDESLAARWGRRLVTVPGYVLAALFAVALLPVLLPAALLLDLREPRRAPRARFVVAVTYLLGCEAAGIVGSLLTWALAGGPLGSGSSRAHRLDRALQGLWARALFTGGRRILGLRLRVTPLTLGDDATGRSERAAAPDGAAPAARPAEPSGGARGPVLVLARHASLVDSLLPCVLMQEVRLRYVLKRELRWDPCLDIVGTRLPNAFVRRGVGDPAEIERVAALARGLTSDEGVVLFPEGTRFTAERRRRLLERFDAAGEAPRLHEASSLRHTLPPRRSGVLALLDAAPAADVVVLVHTGLEGAARLGDLWRGSLQGQTLEVELWRVPRAEIPSDAAGREAWLQDCWRKIDRWIDRRRAAAASGEAAGAWTQPGDTEVAGFDSAAGEWRRPVAVSGAAELPAVDATVATTAVHATATDDETGPR